MMVPRPSQAPDESVSGFHRPFAEPVANVASGPKPSEPRVLMGSIVSACSGRLWCGHPEEASANKRRHSGIERPARPGRGLAPTAASRRSSKDVVSPAAIHEKAHKTAIPDKIGDASFEGPPYFVCSAAHRAALERIAEALQEKRELHAAELADLLDQVIPDRSTESAGRVETKELTTQTSGT